MFKRLFSKVEVSVEVPIQEDIVEKFKSLKDVMSMGFDDLKNLAERLGINTSGCETWSVLRLATLGRLAKLGLLT